MSRTIAAGPAGGLAQGVPAERRITFAKLLRLNIRGPLLVGLIMLIAIIAVAIFAPVLAPYNPIEQHLDQAFTKPWSAVLPMARSDDRIYEYACHEGNYAMTGILRGARAGERGQK